MKKFSSIKVRLFQLKSLYLAMVFKMNSVYRFSVLWKPSDARPVFQALWRIDSMNGDCFKLLGKFRRF